MCHCHVQYRLVIPSCLQNMYNLRSGKQKIIELPVEIQLAEDKQFIDTILKYNCVSDIDNNMSDSRYIWQ